MDKLSDINNLPIPKGFIDKWQESVDLLVKIIQVPAALFVGHNHEFELFISGESETRSSPGIYRDEKIKNLCKTIIKSGKKLTIPNLPKEFIDFDTDESWAIKAFSGFPAYYPNGMAFGVLCIFDERERQFLPEHQQLLLHFKNQIEQDLTLIFASDNNGNQAEHAVIEQLVLKNEELQEAKILLEESNEKFRKIFETAFEAIFIAERDSGIITDVNKSGERLIGRRRDEIVGIHQSELHPEAERDIIKEQFRQVAFNPQLGIIELNVINKKGEIIPVEISSSIMNIDEKNYVLGFFKDIRHRKKIEQQLKQSEAELSEIFDSSQDNIFMVDFIEGKRFRIRKVNAAQAKFFGTKPENMQGLFIDEMLDEQNAKPICEKYLQCIDSRQSIQYEEIAYMPYGEVNFSTSITPIFDENNTPVRLIGISRNITENKLAEKALIESEEKYKNLVENTSDIIWEIDLDGIFKYVSPQSFDILGYLPEELVGKNAFDLMTPEEAERVGKEYAWLIENKSPIRGMINRNLHKKGHEIIIESSGIPILGQNNELVGYKGIDRDITERKRAEEALKESEMQLRLSNDAKDKFFAILAHDLKNPFNSILGFSQLLLKNIHRYNKSEIEEQVSIISNMSQQTYNLLEEILLWAKLQIGKLKFEPEKVNFIQICNEIFDGFKEQANAKKIKFNCFEADKNPIVADVNMFKTIMRNLVSNAIKFSYTGGKIDVYSIYSEQKWTVTIADNGTGIDKQDLNTLWEINGYKSKPGTSYEKGSGFGLVLCKEFVEKHRGTIWVESLPGVGSKFAFTIPASNH